MAGFEVHDRAVEQQEQPELRKAQTFSGNVGAALEFLQNDHQQRMESVRRLRAWQAMLVLNRAYRLMFREGWHGRRELLRWLARAPIAGLGDLREEEPIVVDSERLGDLTSALRKASFGSGDSPVQEAATQPPAACSYDLLVFPVFEYDFRFQRPQQIVRQFARLGHRVWWLSPSRRSAPGKPYEVEEIEPRLWELRVDTPLPDIYAGELTAEGAAPLVRCLRRFLTDWSAASCCAFVQFPYWAEPALSLTPDWCSKVVYDYMDDWEHFPDVSESARERHRRLVGSAGVVLASSDQLLQSSRDAGASPTLVRNAVEFDHFSSPAFTESINLERPIVGYFGAIADWFDFDLVRELASLRPDYSIVLIGGFGLEEDLVGPQVHKLKGLPNVTLVGHKPYEELPRHLAYFDVCIIPFIRNELTQATDPVKIYDYFSQGKPVVTTPMQELNRLNGLVYQARGAHEFAAAIDTALAEEDDTKARARIEFGRENDWRSRQAEVDTALVRSCDKVSIIMVTYNSERFLRPCLDSLLRHTAYPSYEVVIIDNASSDGTGRILREYADRDCRIKVMIQPDNLGFSGGNNLGVRASSGKWLVLLNADTVLTSGWLSGLMRHAANDSSLGLLVPVTNSIGNEAMIECSYESADEMHRYAAELGRAERNREYPLEVAALFCTLIRRRVWGEIGPLDERFKIGMFEDDDYSRRVRQAGYRIAAAEDIFVHHFGGGSFKALEDGVYQGLFRANQIRFNRKWPKGWRPHQYRPGIVGPNRATPSDQFVSEGPVSEDKAECG